MDRSGGQASGWRLAEAGREASWLVGGWQRSGVAAEASGCEREREGGSSLIVSLIYMRGVTNANGPGSRA